MQCVGVEGGCAGLLVLMITTYHHTREVLNTCLHDFPGLLVQLHALPLAPSVYSLPLWQAGRSPTINCPSNLYTRRNGALPTLIRKRTLFSTHCKCPRQAVHMHATPIRTPLMGVNQGAPPTTAAGQVHAGQVHTVNEMPTLLLRK